jgi:hypothetical protein
MGNVTFHRIIPFLSVLINEAIPRSLPCHKLSHTGLSATTKAKPPSCVSIKESISS